MAGRAAPSGFEQIRGEELGRMYGGLLRARRYIQPFLTLVLLYVIVVDPARWRGVLMVSIAVFAAVMSGFEARRSRRLQVARYRPRALDAFSLFLSLVATIVATGGLHSPMLLWIVPFLIIVAICQERVTALALLVVAIALGFFLATIDKRALWMMPLTFLDETGHTNTMFAFCWAMLFATFALSAFNMGRFVRGMADSMLTRSLEARDEALKVHLERLRDLTTMSGEIAHELKNPLASIKGLAQLIELDLARAPERVRILQGEVERMRSVLEEFLNFSRPLVPLTQSQVDLRELCRDVIDLHEGLAGSRRISLQVPGEGQLAIRCDSRKIKQILINLVQNAVEASPDGTDVQIALDRRSDVASMRVLDRGHGLAPDLVTRAFEAGVTSKGKGSGLGLTIVRTLAEQHGGSVNLANRDGGGCVAEVLLPIAGAAQIPVEARV